MTSIVAIKTSPRRMLSPKEAALYCGEPFTTFEARCPCKPRLNSRGQKLYDIKDLDKWLDPKDENDRDSEAAIMEKLG